MPSRRKSGSAKRRTFDVINPTTEKALATYPILTAPQVRTKVGAAREAFRSWSRLDPKERAAYLLRFAEVLRKHKDTYAQTMTLEMGKVIREAVAEVEKCAWAAEYFAENGPGFLQPEIVTTDVMRSYVAFHPRGVLGSIMPWNFPMWQIVRFAVPALIAGNTVVVKPASASPQSALNLGEAFREAGFSDGTFQVVDSVAKEFTAKFVEQVRTLRVGDPLRPTTDIGPLVNEAQREEIEGQVKDAVRKGARVEVGGKRVTGPGWFYEPTVLSRVTKTMRVLHEETFGPVAPILVVPDLDAAVREANDSEFGLGASLWTQDLKRAERLVRQIESGMVFVNGVVKSDPRMPFGGVKHSGIGRELSRYGLLEMVNIKTVEIFPAHSTQAAIQKNTE